MLRIAMLSTGEEVLHGDIVDTNASWLSALFFEHGFFLTKRSTVGDSLTGLTEELLMLSFNNDIVVVNGGLGPTSDDVSSQAASDAAEQPLILFPSWLEKLEAFFTSRGMSMPESNRKQAMLPEKATLIDNPVGTACGFKVRINDCVFYFTPGVPKEFKIMVETQIIPDLKQVYPDHAGLECSKLYTFGTSESALSDKLDKLELPSGYMLGYRSYLPYIEVKLFGPKGDLDIRIKLLKIIFKLIEPNVVSIDEPMVDAIGHLVAERKRSISTAEQSTHGWLANWLNSNERTAHYCGHGWILGNGLNVGGDDQDSLAAVFALAGATREKCATDISLVTGKLVDQQFTVAISTPEGEWGRKLSFNRHYTASEQKEVIGTIAADLLRRYLSGRTMFAQYSSITIEKDMHVPHAAISASS